MKTPALLTLSVLALTALAATPDGAGAEPLAAAVPEHLAGLVDSLRARHGWVNAVFSWMGVCGSVGKLVGTFLQGHAERFLAKVVESHDPGLRAVVERCLNSRGYRFFCFFVDYLIRVKFPAKLPQP